MGLRCTADFRTVNHPNYSFSFPSCQRFATSGSSHYPCSVTDAMSCHSSDKAAEASEMPKFVASPFQRCYCPRMCFDAFWSQFRVFVGAYTLARPSVHTCIAIFQTYGALGLPMCHIFQVSGSSLPVSIFIGRWIDHINLQAEVMESGMKMFPHMVGHEWLWWISGNFIQSV